MSCYARRGVAERFKAAALETVVCAKRTVDSNLTPSAETPPCDAYLQLPPWGNGRLRHRLVSRRQGCPYPWRGEGGNS